MANIWFTSDLHFGHDKEFIWKARGFENIEEMNKTIIERFNSKVQPEDTVYILGDSMLGDAAIGEECLKQLNGNKIIIIGNHDTANRIKIYQKYAEEVVYAKVIKYKKKNFYLSHYPTITGNLDDSPHTCVINLYGHTHQLNNFFEERPYMYHVGVDSHNCYPVSIDDIIKDYYAKVDECLKFVKEETNEE